MRTQNRLLGAVLTGAVIFGGNAYGKKPNILLIVADDLGWNDVGFHGATDVHTPTIDALANSGVILDNYYVQPICTPTRAQILTGRYAGRYGLNHHVLFPPQPSGLDLNELIIPQYLKKYANYATHLVGKWHLGMFAWDYLPTRRGFDSFYGYLNGAVDYYTKLVTAYCPFMAGGEEGRWKYNGIFTAVDFMVDEHPHNLGVGTYSAELYSQRVDKLLKNHVENQADQPLFMMLAPQNVHAPQQAPARFFNESIADPQRRVHSAMIGALDELIKNVTDSFKSHGLFDDTLIIFTTDNGGQTRFGGSNFPLKGRKDTLWQGGIRGTAFVAGAGVEKLGAASRVQMQSTDWLPSILDRVMGKDGFEPVNELDGKSVDWGRGEETWDREILVNVDPIFVRPYGGNPTLQPYPTPSGFNTTHGNAALIHNNWKLITGDPGWSEPTTPPTTSKKLTFTPVDRTMTPLKNDNLSRDHLDHLAEFQTTLHYERSGDTIPSVHLYDLKTDPLETKNLAKTHPVIVEFLLERLNFYNQTVVKEPWWPACDAACDPRLHGDHWVPWKP